MIVPQCPDSLTWGVQTNEIIKNLVDEYMNKGKVDPDRIYLMDGSMGGTGVWRWHLPILTCLPPLCR